MKETRQFAAYTADVEGGDIQTLSFPGIRDIKGVKIIFSSALTNGSPVASARIGVGYWDGSTHRAMSIQASDNDTTPNCGTRHDTATIIQFINPTNTNLAAEAEVSSVGAEYVKLHWSDYPTNANLFEVTVYYGSDVSCNLHDFTPSASINGTATKTGLSFAPNALEVLHVNGTAFAADSAFTTSALGIGYACEQSDGTTLQQACTTLTDRNLPSSGQTENGQTIRDDCVAQKVTVAAAGTVTAGARLDVTDYTSDGYTITTRDVAESVACVVFAIRFGTGERWVAIPSIANASTGTKSISTSPTFQPQHVDAVATSIDTKNVVYDAAVAATRDLTHIGIGGGRVATQNVASWRSASGVLPSVAQAQADNELLHTGQWSATLLQYTSTGFDIDVTDAADTTARLAFFMAIGGAQALAHAFGETVQISDAQAWARGAVLGTETVSIAETNRLIFSSLIVGETVSISESNTIIRSAILVDETVSIAEAEAWAIQAIINESVTISEDVVLVTETSNDQVMVVNETVTVAEAIAIAWLLDASEQVSIAEAALFVFTTLQISEDVEILEQVVFVGTGVGATIGETVQISEQVVMYLGNVLTANESVQISEQVSFGAGLVPGKSGPGIGGTVQGGAAAGKTAQGGARFGKTIQ